MLLEAQSALCNPSNPAPHQDRQQKTTTHAPLHTQTHTHSRAHTHTHTHTPSVQKTDNVPLSVFCVKSLLNRKYPAHSKILVINSRLTSSVDVQSEAAEKLKHSQSLCVSAALFTYFPHLPDNLNIRPKRKKKSTTSHSLLPLSILLPEQQRPSCRAPSVLGTHHRPVINVE